jgi:hypothetical protein
MGFPRPTKWRRKLQLSMSDVGGGNVWVFWATGTKANI